MNTNGSRRRVTGVLVAGVALLAALSLSGFGEGRPPGAAAAPVTTPVTLYSQACASVSMQKAGDQVQVIMRRVSRVTLSIGQSAAAGKTLDTKTFVGGWAVTFKGVQPRATLATAVAGGAGGGLQIGAITAAQYLNGDVVYLCRPGAPPQSGRLPLWSPFPSLPATLGPSVLLIDPAGVTDPGTGLPGTPPPTASGAMYGMACGYWQKPINDYQNISLVPGYFDDYFRTIRPYTTWVTNYGLLWDADPGFVTAAHKAGLRVCVCIDPTWSATGPASTNQDQIGRAVALIEGGVADSVVVGNEVLNKFDKAYGYDAWKNDMIGYINQIRAAKNSRGQSVPVGTSYAMNVYDDAGKAQEEEVNRNCDFLQITVHPANVARDQLPWGPGGSKITTPDDGIWFLDKCYATARAQMDAWGFRSKPLEIRETGWPSKSDFGNVTDAYFTVANARDYCGKVQQWAAGKSVNVYWFEAVDEPEKGPLVDQGKPYDQDDFEANWGIWHWTPVDADDLDKGGAFGRKY